MPAPSTLPNPDTEPRAAAWTASDLQRNPHEVGDKADRVRRMFAAIARAYDLNNTLHSFGRDAAWRRAAVAAAGLRGGEAVLDVACGTGALTREFARGGRSGARPARVIGADFTPEMLDIARERLACAHGDGPSIEYYEADAQALPFDDAAFDVVSIAFGIRNVREPETAIREFRRVLRPGGRLVVLEFSRPSFPPAAWANDLYTRHIMPRTATLISRDRSGAYLYLPKSVGEFMSRADLAALVERSGFTTPDIRPLTFGVCSLYRAAVPPAQGG